MFPQYFSRVSVPGFIISFEFNVVFENKKLVVVMVQKEYQQKFVPGTTKGYIKIYMS
jgi:hypothetical protein